MKGSVVLLILLLFFVGYCTTVHASKRNETKKYRKQLKMKSIYRNGVEFCEWFAYYGSTNPTYFCETTQVGSTLIFVGSIAYVLLWIAIIIFSFFLLKFARDL